MKKLAFFSFATLAVLLSGCADLTSVGNTEGETNTIAAVMEGVQTKTSTTDEGHFSWSEGDKIWLEATGDYVMGVLSEGAGTPNATFTYGAYFGDLTGKSVYPYNAGHSVEEDVLNVALPASYDLGSNLDNTNAPMYGVKMDGTLKFNHLAGVMRFSFKNVPAGVDRFIFTVDKKINGTFAADLTADYPVLQTEAAKVDAERTVTFNFDALANTSDIKIYVPLPLGTYESLELALYKGEESVWTYSKAVTNTINRKSLKLMPTVSMGGSIGGDIENDGTIGGDIEGGEDVYMTYLRKDEHGACGVTKVENETATSCDYIIKSFADNASDNGYTNIYDALYFDTNLTEWKYVVPAEDRSWLTVGRDPDNNVILIQAGPNEEGAERRSKIEITSMDANTLYYTINVIQAPEPVTYINCDGSNHTVSSNTTYDNNVSVYSNAKELMFEALTDSPWISIVLCKANGDHWVVEANMDANTTTERRTAEFKVYPVGKPETYVVLSYEQYGLDAYMTYLRKDEFGLYGVVEVKNVTATSCDYTIKAFADNDNYGGSERIYDALYFDTNLPKGTWTYVVPGEDESWLNVGMDPDQNVILIQAGPNEEGAERSSKIEIRSRNTNALYYTINVIQAPEPVTYINCDGSNHTVSSNTTYDNNVSVYSNAKELMFEALTDSPWISIVLCKANGDHWVVEANMDANTTTERRTAEFKVYPVGKPETYVVLSYEQYGLDAYMTYLRKDEFGVYGVAEVENETATSCDYIIKSFADNASDNGYTNIYDALYFDTNLTEWKYVVPAEDKSWLTVGMDPEQNVILIQAGPNEGSAERRSKIEIRSKNTNTLYYTINVIQAPEPEAYVNCDNCYHTVSCNTTYDNNVSVYSDAKQLVYEPLTSSPWITINLCKANGDHWVVEANMSANRTAERRTAEFKVYPAGRPSTYVILTYEQYALGE